MAMSFAVSPTSVQSIFPRAMDSGRIVGRLAHSLVHYQLAGVAHHHAVALVIDPVARRGGGELRSDLDVLPRHAQPARDLAQLGPSPRLKSDLASGLVDQVPRRSRRSTSTTAPLTSGSLRRYRSFTVSLVSSSSSARQWYHPMKAAERRGQRRRYSRCDDHGVASWLGLGTLRNSTI